MQGLIAIMQTKCSSVDCSEGTACFGEGRQGCGSSELSEDHLPTAPTRVSRASCFLFTCVNC
jgi:hypothetical protein